MRTDHYRMASALWVPGGIEESGSRQDSNVFPAGGLATHPPSGLIAATDLLADQHPEDLRRVPALRPRGGQHLGGRVAEVGQPLRLSTAPGRV